MKMEISYQKDESNQYMIIQPEQELPEEDYRIRMLSGNHPRGLLPFARKTLEGQVQYFYDITNCQSMEQYGEKERFGQKTLMMIFRGFYQLLTEIKKYMLDADGLYLTSETVYLDKTTGEPRFCYVPALNQEARESFHRFTEYLLRQVDSADQGAVLLCYRLYQESAREDCSLEQLLRDNEKSLSLGEYQKKSEAEWGRSFQKNRKAEQRPTWGAPQEKRIQSREATIIEEKPDDCFEPRTPDMAAIGDKNRNTVSKRTVKKKSKNIFPVLIAAAVGTAAAAGLFLGCRFELLSVTQAGGIAFLLTGLAAYGRIFLKKNARSDRERVRAMEYEAVKRVEKQNRREHIREKKQDRGLGAVLKIGKKEKGEVCLAGYTQKDRRRILLTRQEHMIGKLSTRCDICIPNPKVSRVHAKLIREKGAYYICDLDSKNGTYVNGKKIRPREKILLKNEDEIIFADVGYHIEYRGRR
ncbi:MAG: DUF6382 domain-containing protein [Eubacteriales bacterium]|nr:DUF6382 domain-containing protein [Eubacteriales bacterium]